MARVRYSFFFQNIKMNHWSIDFENLSGFENLNGPNDLNSLFGLKKSKHHVLYIPIEFPGIRNLISL